MIDGRHSVDWRINGEFPKLSKRWNDECKKRE